MGSKSKAKQLERGMSNRPRLTMNRSSSGQSSPAKPSNTKPVQSVLAKTTKQY